MDKFSYNSFKVPKSLNKLGIKNHKWIDLEDD